VTTRRTEHYFCTIRACPPESAQPWGSVPTDHGRRLTKLAVNSRLAKPPPGALWGMELGRFFSVPRLSYTRCMKKQRCAIYARVSRDSQKVDMQLHDLRRYADQRGFEISREFIDEGFSGSLSSRPALNEMMDGARKRKYDVVLVWRFDRFARSTQHLLSALEEFGTLGIEFISYQENLDTTTPLGKMVFTLVSSIATLERDIIRDRVRAGLATARSKGKRLGRPPKANSDEIMKLRAEGLSFRQISEQLGIAKSTVMDAVRKRSPKSTN